MNIQDYVSQYKNTELCAKWDNNIPLSELDGNEFILITDIQDIQALYNSFSFLPLHEAIFGDESLYLTSINGVIVTVVDGDYGEVYVTESSKPYDLSAIYHPLDYYL